MAKTKTSNGGSAFRKEGREAKLEMWFLSAWQSGKGDQGQAAKTMDQCPGEGRSTKFQPEEANGDLNVGQG
jgi:hypothetical protein